MQGKRTRRKLEEQQLFSIFKNPFMLNAPTEVI